MLMPTVKQYMTREPYSIASRESLARAQLLMKHHDIRHLPVVDGSRLIGVISERDIAVTAAMNGSALDHVEVARIMEPALDVWGESPLDEVADLMAARKRDCVVVRGGQGVEGIFTAVDALQALADLARRATT